VKTVSGSELRGKHNKSGPENGGKCERKRRRQRKRKLDDVKGRY
jgi:hypothetical protein